MKQIQDALVKYAEDLIRKSDLTNSDIKQLSMRQLSGMKMLDDKLASLDNKLGGIFNLMVNLPEADVPTLFFITPSTDFEGTGFVNVAKNFKKRWSDYYYDCSKKRWYWMTKKK